jgi:hypothetical protein
MIVKAILDRIKNIDNNEIIYELTIGKEYFVLQLEFNHKDRVFDDVLHYRIISDEGIMLPCPSRMFEIVDNRIPSGYIIGKLSADFIEILPFEFSYVGFLEDYYNGDEKAYNIVMNKIEFLEKNMK